MNAKEAKALSDLNIRCAFLRAKAYIDAKIQEAVDCAEGVIDVNWYGFYACKHDHWLLESLHKKDDSLPQRLRDHYLEEGFSVYLSGNPAYAITISWRNS